MKNLISLGVFLLILLSVQVNAQEQSVLKIRPTGRILMDGGLFHSDNKNFVDGVAIPDARIGVKATYGKYKAKVDIGYAYGKVSLKDIFVERQFSSHALLRVGNFVHQFGLQSSTSSSMKVTMEEPASNEAFFNSRLMGAMFVYDKNDFFGTASVHVESEALKKKSNELGKMGYGAMSRLVYRPLHDTGRLFQLGISGAYETPRYNSEPTLNHTSFDLGANFPTRIAKVRAVNALIPDAKNLIKFTPEMLCKPLHNISSRKCCRLSRMDCSKSFSVTKACSFNPKNSKVTGVLITSLGCNKVACCWTKAERASLFLESPLRS